MKLLARHPKGLPVLFLTELWERVGFYVLMAILTLYMKKELGWSVGSMGTVYGGFLALCYGFPLLGGWLGDRVLGPVRTVRIGAALMTLGYVCLGLSSRTATVPFLGGLLLIGVGTGIFKVNMSVLVGNLYRNEPAEADAGFNIYYMGVNIGATIGPVGATLVGLRCQSYRPSFWVAAAGMVVAQIIFTLGRRHLVESSAPTGGMGASGAEAGRDDRARLLALVGLFLAAIFFWTAFYQNGFALTLFAEQSTRAYHLLRPETYQFFEPAFILVFTPLMLLGLARLAKRGRAFSTPAKILGGMLVMAVSVLVMVLASHLGGNLDQPILSPLWLVGSYALVTLAEILISPMGQSYVSRVAPPRYRGFMMGGWFASTALGSYLSGSIGSFYARIPHDIYYLLITGLLLVSAALTLLMYRTLKRF